MKKEVVTKKSKVVKPKSPSSKISSYERALKVASSLQKKKLHIAANSKKNILKFISENLAS